MNCNIVNFVEIYIKLEHINTKDKFYEHNIWYKTVTRINKYGNNMNNRGV